MSLASGTLLLGVAPAAQADCCSSAGPRAGRFVVRGDEALLPIERPELQLDGPTLRHGAVARVGADGRLVRPFVVLPGAEAALPVLAGAESVSAAWAQAPGAVWLAGLDAAGRLTGSVAVGSTRSLDDVQLAAAPDGSRLVVWRDGSTLHACRVDAVGAVGVDVVISSGLQAPRFVRLVADVDGNAVLVFGAGGLRALRIPVGTRPAPGRAVALGGTPSTRVLALASDGAGGVALVTRESGTTLIQLPGGPTASAVRTRLDAGVAESAALAPGAVAYLAHGRSGQADVMVRRLRPGAAPGRSINVSTSTAAEREVSAVAAGPAGKVTLAYVRSSGDAGASDLFLRSVVPGTGKQSVEQNLSGSRHEEDGAAQLAVAADGTAYVAWTGSREVAEDVASYICDRLVLRVVSAHGTPMPTQQVAGCDVESAT